MPRVFQPKLLRMRARVQKCLRILLSPEVNKGSSTVSLGGVESGIFPWAVQVYIAQLEGLGRCARRLTSAAGMSADRRRAAGARCERRRETNMAQWDPSDLSSMGG